MPLGLRQLRNLCVRKSSVNKNIVAALLLPLSCLSAADPTTTAARAVNNLALDLLAHAVQPQENTALSPYSIQLALVMTYAGAEGDTRQQMAKVLHYPSTDSDVLRDFAQLQDGLDKMAERTAKIATESKKVGGPSEPIALTVANRLFGQQGYDFRPAYLELLKKTLDSPLEALDFISDSAGATKHINHWIAQQTKERIRDLIPPNVLNKDTRLVLANAFYLKAPWKEEFKQNETRPAPFHFADGGSADVPTMRRQDAFGYAKHDGFVAVALPYAGGDLQFLVLLPDTAVGLPKLESELTPDLLAECARLKPEELILHLPKWKLEPPLFALRKTFEALGMESAFDVPQGSANFNGIAAAATE